MVITLKKEAQAAVLCASHVLNLSELCVSFITAKWSKSGNMKTVSTSSWLKNMSRHLANRFTALSSTFYTFLSFCPGDTEKIRQLENTIHGLTKDLSNMQTTINGINQRLYVTVVFNTRARFISWTELSVSETLFSGNKETKVLLGSRMDGTFNSCLLHWRYTSALEWMKTSHTRGNQNCFYLVGTGWLGPLSLQIQLNHTWRKPSTASRQSWIISITEHR